ncbi:MAG TPA: hypothetical protein VFI31_06755 [Pirellulales bacterium]|nr:hypothetical protein [Pirellulales bacterium]
MAMTFDATLKDMARECPEGFLAAFDRRTTQRVSVLNVDLSAVTAAADIVYGLGEPPQEIIHIDCQSSAAAWKHADLLLYNAVLFARYHVPVHTVVVLLRPEAAHSNMDGTIDYAPRPEHGSMSFRYQVERLWLRSAEELLAGDVGVAPLAVLGRFPEGAPLEEAIANVAERIVERLTKEAPPDRARKLLTDALLLTGLRVKREVAAKIFRGVRMMEESDTYLMIVDEGKEKQVKEDILLFGEERLGPPDEATKVELNGISDLDRLKRLVRRTAKATAWREILDTP